MGKLNFFLDLQVKKTPKGTIIRQQNYIKKLLKIFNMETSKTIDTPIATATCLDMDELGSPESHLKAAKRILRYLKGMQDLVLYYPSGDNFDLIGYVDADYARYMVDRKSTSGMALFLGSYLISWGTRKQKSVALSTVEAEYVAATSCYAQLLWIKQ
ncbi:secreted RxLR effector protein 161-like [Nicotiana tabacum]|uniref:Secreted RxLR effector protein 161-like n=1 Tax=Nicotiana tabacum TaxID=4097 RepID=A0AC58TQD5_TOBAC